MNCVRVMECMVGVFNWVYRTLFLPLAPCGVGLKGQKKKMKKTKKK